MRLVMLIYVRNAKAGRMTSGVSLERSKSRSSGVCDSRLAEAEAEEKNFRCQRG